MKNKEIINELEHMLNLLQDSANGYRHLAGHLENNELKSVMNRLSQQRKQFCEELRIDARDMGARLEPEGTYKGYFHRMWMDIRSVVSGAEDEKRMEEAIRGEKYLVEAYDAILRDREMPDYVEERLAEQRNMILGVVDQWKEFERILT